MQRDFDIFELLVSTLPSVFICFSAAGASTNSNAKQKTFPEKTTKANQEMMTYTQIQVQQNQILEIKTEVMK